MLRLIDVNAAALGESNCRCVKALDQAHRVGVGMVWGKYGQFAAQPAAIRRDEYRRALAPKIGRKLCQVGRSCIRRHENENCRRPSLYYRAKK
jgi:hypothetical protein